MNKNELVRAVAESADITVKDADAAVTAMVDVITNTLQQGEKVQLMGFGSFEVKKRAARTGRNPQTNEPMEIPAAIVPLFKPGRILKEAVDKQ
ncbi:MAG: HU family DNA-binding protein [Oscillibacter sp.]|nr:HU family DNA-binding protein [Oscillibacter sp.]